MRRLPTLGLGISVVILAAIAGLSTGQMQPARALASVAGSSSAASGAATAGRLPAFGHVFVIILENKEANQVMGSAQAPYFNQLAAQFARAGNYYAIGHPSLPNYLALTGGSTFGIKSDCTKCYVAADNVAVQVEQAGRSWKAYMEAVPNSCYSGPDTQRYAQRHNPFMYYDNIRTDPARCQKVVPLTQLQADLSANTLPDFAWISPDVCGDMHNCGIGTGDAWLKTWVPQILASPAWQKNGVLFILFDEGNSSAGCCGRAAGGKVAPLVISPLVRPGYVSTVAYDHYSVLRTIEEAWGLPLLGEAGSSATTSMADFFPAAPQKGLFGLPVFR